MLGRRASLVGIATTLFLMVAVVVVSSDYRPFFSTPDRNPRVPHLQVTLPKRSGRSASAATSTAPAKEHHSNLIPYLVDAFLALFALLLVIVLVTAAVRAIGRFRNPFRRMHRRHSDRDPIPDVLDEVTQAVSAQRSSLTLGAPRNAIIDCWISLEHAVEEAGVPLRASETSAELVIRVIDELDADSDALSRLGRLYRRARFSSHDITEDDRAAALDALHALEGSLREAAESRGEQRVESS